MNVQNIVLGVIVPKLHKFPVKNEILAFSSSGAGHGSKWAGSVTQWIRSGSTQYEWGFEKRL